MWITLTIRSEKICTLSERVQCHLKGDCVILIRLDKQKYVKVLATTSKKAAREGNMR